MYADKGVLDLFQIIFDQQVMIQVYRDMVHTLELRIAELTHHVQRTQEEA